MAEQPKLLVVDDEDAICEGCRRIFSRQGFDVSKSSDPQDGLDLAAAGDFACILLDIKMPEMTGLEFLSRLRTTHQNTPVILMTGYPSMPNAISAVRLGASGYVTKPFTPEEITQAVHRFVPLTEAVDVVTTSTISSPSVPAPDAPAAYRFWHESWMAPTNGDEYRCGAVLPPSVLGPVAEVFLPSIGEVVFQGLPMASVRLSSGETRQIPAPLTGVIEDVNAQLAKAPGLLASDPCGDGWLAQVCATRVDEELKHGSTRRVLVVSQASDLADQQCSRLNSLGCETRVFSDLLPGAGWDALSRALLGHQYGMLLLDAGSLGSEGPRLVSQIHQASPTTRIVVMASPDCRWEAEYRAEKIFYYAVGAFEDDEIVEVVGSVFQTPVMKRAKAAKGTVGDEPIASISITNRQGSRVMLVAGPGVLRRNTGLGVEIRGLLYDGLYPIKTLPGEAKVSPRDILNAAQVCDRVLLLLSKDMQRLPGTLVRDSGTEFVALTGEDAGKVTTLVVQPPAEDQPIDGLDRRTLVQLAQHIVGVMATA